MCVCVCVRVRACAEVKRFVLSVETKCDTYCTLLFATVQLHSHQHTLHLQPKREVKGKAKKALKAD